MSLFKKKNPENKKNEINAASVDLRNYTANALREIDRINAAVIIIPKNPDNELIEAYASIDRKSVV